MKKDETQEKLNHNFGKIHDIISETFQKSNNNSQSNTKSQSDTNYNSQSKTYYESNTQYNSNNNQNQIIDVQEYTIVDNSPIKTREIGLNSKENVKFEPHKHFESENEFKNAVALIIGIVGVFIVSFFIGIISNASAHNLKLNEIHEKNKKKFNEFVNVDYDKMYEDCITGSIKEGILKLKIKERCVLRHYNDTFLRNYIHLKDVNMENEMNKVPKCIKNVKDGKNIILDIDRKCMDNIIYDKIKEMKGFNKEIRQIEKKVNMKKNYNSKTRRV